MRISSYDKQQIKLIDEQVLLLLDKDASETAIFEALIDFVPDVKCLVENAEAGELKLGTVAV